MTHNRRQVLSQIAEALAKVTARHTLRVAIDGRSGAGKTTFADELAAALAEAGRPVIRTSIDGFHRPKAERYARGRYSAEGYYYDARDLGAVRRLLLDPLGPGGNGQYRPASFDLASDIPINQPPCQAEPNSVLIVDGTFLQRAELVGGWDAVIFLDVSDATSERRGIVRDTALLGGAEAARQLYAQRYRPAYALYEQACHPREIADAVVDNEDFVRPSLTIRAGSRLSL